MRKIANRVSLGAVHTHTHTQSTFRKIRRVANEATLFGVKDRLFVALYEGKNKVLEIACFLREILQEIILKKYYTSVRSESNLSRRRRCSIMKRFKENSE